MSDGLSWVILTRGDRPDELADAVASVCAADDPSAVPIDVLVLVNGRVTSGDGSPAVASVPSGARTVSSDTNLGVPGGRDAGLRLTAAGIVGFLDDDARVVTDDAARLIVEAFEQSPTLGAVGFRIVDEAGTSARRHVPRVGAGSAERPGRVVTFLGGACAVRRSAYEAAGGYWADLFYAHEELELAWRLHDAGYEVAYDPRIEVVHPHTPISRHADGWRLTGRNRVMIARRDLPWPIAVPHVLGWLVLGLVRAPDRRCRSAYARGWWSGWSHAVDRRPISWRTVVELTRRGRPPIV